MRSGTGWVHSNRWRGAKWVHCWQACSSARHLEHWPSPSVKEGEVCRSQRSGRPFGLEASRADAVPTIPRAFLLSPFRNRGIRAGHIFCPSCWLPSLLMLVYSKEQCVSLRCRDASPACRYEGQPEISLTAPGSDLRLPDLPSRREKTCAHRILRMFGTCRYTALPSDHRLLLVRSLSRTAYRGRNIAGKPDCGTATSEPCNQQRLRTSVHNPRISVCDRVSSGAHPVSSYVRLFECTSHGNLGRVECICTIRRSCDAHLVMAKAASRRHRHSATS